MNDQEKEKIDLNILTHIEYLSEQINTKISSRTSSILDRYPLTFGFLILFGVVAVSEGAKGILDQIGFFADNPWYLFITGVVLLVITGSLYKKIAE